MRSIIDIDIVPHVTIKKDECAIGKCRPCKPEHVDVADTISCPYIELGAISWCRCYWTPLNHNNRRPI